MHWIVKALISIVGVVVAFIPVWIYIGVRVLLSPEGFWQELVLFGVGVWILGVFQIFFLVVWVACLFVLWGES